jgi:hypothetical protein
MSHRIATIVFFILIFSRTPLLMAQWDVRSFGEGRLTLPFEVKVADARNDGVNRVYVSERNGDVLEWTHHESGWVDEIVAKDVRGLAMIAIGDARNDGLTRIYYSEFNKEGGLFEAEWNGETWSVKKIDAPLQSLCLFLGPGRNDGQNRLYVGTSGSEGGLIEYSYGESGWTSQLQTTSGGMQGTGVVGDLRNDGVNRILAHSSVLDELTWNEDRYDTTPIDHGERLWPAPTGAGDIRNDGLVRIFINGGQGKLEYLCDSPSWRSHRIDDAVRRGDLIAARLHADGLTRLYATFSAKNWGDRLPKGPLTQYSWNGEDSEYEEDIVLDAISGATAKLASGDARNDSVIRLYAPDYEGGRILEITSENPFVATE